MTESVPLKVVLDGHIFDCFEKNTIPARLLNALVCDSKVVVLMPRVVRAEVTRRPAGMPEWLSVHNVLDGEFVPGISIVGSTSVGGDPLFSAHLGHSKRKQSSIDAIIAATANVDADIFVTNDKTSRERRRSTRAVRL